MRKNNEEYKKAIKGRKRKIGGKIKTENKIVDINSNIAVITINVNELYDPIKR